MRVRWLYAASNGRMGFRVPPDRTVALYRCYDSAQESHFASNEADCDGLGAMEEQLGYALAE